MENLGVLVHSYGTIGGAADAGRGLLPDRELLRSRKGVDHASGAGGAACDAGGVFVSWLRALARVAARWPVLAHDGQMSAFKLCLSVQAMPRKGHED